MNLLVTSDTPVSLGRRIALFLYSSQNILGCLLALLGLGLYFIGIIDSGWGYIVAGLYLAGYFAMPRRQAEASLGPDRFNEDNLVQALENTLKEVGPKLPMQARSLLDSIKQTLEGLLPALKSMESEGQLDLRSRVTVMSTLTRYLPETLNAYLRLPPAFAIAHHGSVGKTAQTLLVEQLGALDAQLKQVAQNAYSKDVERLIINGRFLEDKFGSAPKLD